MPRSFNGETMDRPLIEMRIMQIREALGKRYRERTGTYKNAYSYDGSIDRNTGGGTIGSRSRMDWDEEPAAWITLENKEHVPLNSSGIAIGGAGGWAKGKDFSGANYKKKAGTEGPGKKGKTSKGPGDTPKPKAPEKATKEELKKTAADAIRKSDGITGKIVNGCYEYKKWKAERDSAIENAELYRVAVEDQRQKLEKARANSKTTKTAGELVGEVNDYAHKANEAAKWIKDHQYSASPEELSRKKKEWHDLSSKYDETKKLFNAKKKEENLVLGVQYYEAMRNNTEKKLKELEKTGPRGEEYKKLVREYEESIKERDKAVLEAYDSPADCKTSQEATDYLRAKGYFRKDGEDRFRSDQRIDIAKMTPDHGIAYAQQIDRMMKDYPWLKGEVDSVVCHDFSGKKTLKGTYGYALGTNVSFAEGFYGDNKHIPKNFQGDAVELYKKDVKDGYHPAGTDYIGVVDHEITHVMEKVVKRKAEEKGIELLEGRVSNTIMQRVQERLYGKYSKKKEDKIRSAISGYCVDNKGVKYNSLGYAKENKQYGRNTEWLAEAMTEARCSEHPSETAIAVKEEFEKLMKEAGLS